MSNNNYFKLVEPLADITDEEVDIDEEDIDLFAKAKWVTSRRPRPIDWKKFFFFNELSEDDTRRAYAEALSAAHNNFDRIALYQDTPTHGPWVKVRQVK